MPAIDLRTEVLAALPAWYLGRATVERVALNFGSRTAAPRVTARSLAPLLAPSLFAQGLRAVEDLDARRCWLLSSGRAVSWHALRDTVLVPLLSDLPAPSASTLARAVVSLPTDLGRVRFSAALHSALWDEIASLQEDAGIYLDAREITTADYARPKPAASSLPAYDFFSDVAYPLGVEHLETFLASIPGTASRALVWRMYVASAAATGVPARDRLTKGALFARLRSGAFREHRRADGFMVTRPDFDPTPIPALAALAPLDVSRDVLRAHLDRRPKRPREMPADWSTRRAVVIARDGSCVVEEDGRRCTFPGPYEVDHLDGPDSHGLDVLETLCRTHHTRRTYARAHGTEPPA
jgi:hypothetical protein